MLINYLLPEYEFGTKMEQRIKYILQLPSYLNLTSKHLVYLNASLTLPKINILYFLKLLKAVLINSSCFNIPKKFKGRLANESESSKFPPYYFP